MENWIMDEDMHDNGYSGTSMKWKVAEPVRWAMTFWVSIVSAKW